MTYLIRLVVLMITLLIGSHLYAFELSSPGSNQDGVLDDSHARCVYSPLQQKMVYGKNISPALQWQGAPSNTKSFVFLILDPDVPVDKKYVNVKGKTILASAPRQTEYHWILTDIPSTTHLIKAGIASTKVMNENQPIKMADEWTHIVSYKDKKALSTSYFGPCSPCNDELIHHYIFILYALNTVAIPTNLTIPQLLSFIAKHKLGQAQLVLTRTNNPKLR